MLQNSHFVNFHERFFFLYGKTDDEFCLLPNGILKMEEALYWHLRELEYQRILCFNGKRKLYFYDIESKRLARMNPNAPSASESKSAKDSPPATKSRMCNGPLGMKKVRRTGDRANASSANSTTTRRDNNARENGNEPLHYGAMNDMEAATTLDACMRDGSRKTAVIFTDGLDFINHTEQNALRHMAGALNQWSGLFSDNENICIFLLPDLDARNMQTLLERHPQWQFMYGRMFNQAGLPTSRLICVTSPRKDEVENLFHYFRLTRDIPIDWLKLEDATIAVSRNLLAESRPLKSLSVELRKTDALDTAALERLSGRLEEEPALERLKKMRGLEPVARKIEQLVAIKLEEEAEVAEKQSPEPESKESFCQRLMPETPKTAKAHNLHLALVGNPGTGKTHSARLIGEIFREAGLLETGQTIKASREDLVAGYVGQTALRTAEKVREAMGGVLFLDEAYRFSEGSENDFGKEAVETVMEAMSNHMGEISVIIAGYPDRIESFLDSNPGMRRRFGPQNIIQIPDYDPETLHHIFLMQARQNNREIDPGLESILPDFFANWHGARDPETFGNAGDVINLFEEMDSLRGERVRGLDVERNVRRTLTMEDVPDRLKEYLRVRKAATVEEALKYLDDLAGLSEVKAWIKRLARLMQVRQEQRRRGMNVEPTYPGSYLFVGKPGTGKTTVARIMGNIFQLLGLLGRSEPHTAGPSDLIDKFVGGTEEKAGNVYHKALNGILFIDEAHQLAEGGQNAAGRPAVKELVPFMLNNRENLCVIAAGYPEEMEAFLELDPGLKDRFSQTIHFEDFTAEELEEIFRQILAKNHEIAGPGLMEEIRRLFTIWVTDKKRDFSNARAVNKLVEHMRGYRADRLGEAELASFSDEALRTFIVEDIPENQRKRMGKKVDRLEDALDSLDSLIGLDNVKQMVHTLINRLKIDKIRARQSETENAGLAPGHYLFTGNPGTGKTTVARLMGEMFRALGLLKKGHMIETGRSDLVAGYLGQTALKTREVLEQSLDGVLFIDEAYQLVEDDRDSFGKEALETLVAFMENHRDRLCIIAAGYPEPMHRFVNQNPGLPSRFSAEIVFRNYTADEMLEIFKMMARKEKMTLAEGLEQELLKVFETMAENAGPTFGNGREVRKLLDTMLSNQANRLANTSLPPEEIDMDALYRLEREDMPDIT